MSYYNWYNETNILKYPSELVIGFLTKNLKKQSKVLDMGCAAGRHVILSAELGHQAYGIDLSNNSFEICYKVAQNKNLKVNLKQTSMENTGYTDAFFDAVICMAAICGNPLKTQLTIIQEIKRILKPNGIFLISFYGVNDGLYRIMQEKGKEIEDKTYTIPGQHYHPNLNSKEEIPDFLAHFYTIAEVKELLSCFSTVKVFDTYFPYGNGSLADDALPLHTIYALGKN